MGSACLFVLLLREFWSVADSPYICTSTNNKKLEHLRGNTCFGEIGAGLSSLYTVDGGRAVSARDRRHADLSAEVWVARC